MFNNLDKFTEAILIFLNLCFQIGAVAIMVFVFFSICKVIDFIINYISPVMT